MEKVNKYEILLQIYEPIILENGQSQCPLCSKILGDKFKVARHILIHTGEKSFYCSQCNYASNQKAHLKRHFNSKHCENYVKIESK